MFGDTIFQPIEEISKDTSHNSDLASIPIVGEIISMIMSFFGWIWAGLNVLFNLLTFNIGHGIPTIVRILILVPYYGVLIYIILPVLIEFMKGIGNLIPFT